MATWAQSPNRRLTLFVRLLNKSGQTLQMPVRLYLPSTGITVVAPSGTPASKVVPLTPDSTEAGGGKIWFIGGTGTLAANDSTVQDTIKVNVMSPVTQARFQFTATANTASVGGPVPALPPDSVPSAVWAALHAPANMVASAPWNPAPFARNLVLVTFKENTPQASKQAAIDAIGGQVVGGNRSGNGGIYYVTIVDDGTPTPLFNAINTLKTFPDVEIARAEALALAPGYLRPQDGSGWKRSNWEVNSNAPPSGDNWALEEIAAPLAWGCSVGDNATRIGVSDVGFDSLPDLVGNLDPTSRPRYGSIGGQLGTLAHGDAVLSVLAARGNNDTSMTGTMWASRLHVRELSVVSTDSTENLRKDLELFAQQGVRIVSSSQWIDWDGYYKPDLSHPHIAATPPNASDSVDVNKVVAELSKGIRLANSSAGARAPLIVALAGNKPLDSCWGGRWRIHSPIKS